MMLDNYGKISYSFSAGKRIKSLEELLTSTSGARMIRKKSTALKNMTAKSTAMSASGKVATSGGQPALNFSLPILSRN